MLSAKEKGFKRYWEDQRTGGKWLYISLFTLGWAMMIFFTPLIVSFVIDIYNFLHLYKLQLWQAILLSVVIGFALSLYFWTRNEERWQHLVEKEQVVD